MSKTSSLKISVVIIELSTHNEVLEKYLQYLNELNVVISIITSQRNYNYLSQHHSKAGEWRIINKDSLNKEDFLFIDRHQVCFVLSIHLSNHRLIEKKWNIPTALLIHNSNTCFFDKESSIRSNSISNAVRKLKYKVLNLSNKRKRALDSYDRFLLPSLSIYEHITSYLKDHRKDKISYIPIMSGILNFKPRIKNQETPISIVVPGTVSQTSRDYQQLINAIPKIDESINDNIIIQFLGKASGKTLDILKSIETNLTFVKLKYYTDEIDQRMFDQSMRQADFLILPIHSKITYGVNKEYFGKTWISGNLNDFMRYRKPSIVPSYFPKLDFWESLILRYDDSDQLINTINNWINNKEYLRKHISETAIQKEFYANRARLESTISELLKLKS